MYGADYAWILQETLGTQWWREEGEVTECSQKNLQSAIENVLIVTSHNSIVGEETSYSGLVRRQSYYLKLFHHNFK
jgi:gamma-aminobutyric acid type B receptor